MASRVGRLGPVLRDHLVEALRLLDAQASPRGEERAVALALRDWSAARWPEIAWTVEPVDSAGANLVAHHDRPGPLLYSHLDTSLDGGARDGLVTGSDEPVGPLRVQHEVVDGFGLTVARAPAAAALVAFAHAGRGSLLLAGSGTHRRHGTSSGVSAYLAAHARPASAIVAKSGPPGVIWEEPGAAYLDVRITGRSGAAVLATTALPAGGLVPHLGVVMAAIESWREAHLAAALRSDDLGQMLPACGIGSVRAGWDDKPDLLPGIADIGLYLVLLPGDDPVVLGEQLRDRIRRSFVGTALAPCDVSVDVELVHAAERTSQDASVVRAAVAAWKARFGEDPPAVSWSGSTDGVVLRAAGIETVRLGPTGRPATDDPRRDAFDLPTLVDFAAIYRTLLDG